MLWEHYVFRRGADVQDMWERMYTDRVGTNAKTRILYIAGRGFDRRAQLAMQKYIESVIASNLDLEVADLLLIEFSDYRLSEELILETKTNSDALEKQFARIGKFSVQSFGSSAFGEEELSATSALRMGTESVVTKLSGYTDVILDVSSLPRVIYLALMTSILNKLVPNKSGPNALSACEVNFQVIVAEDVRLDSQITSEDPSNDLVLIPGFTSALQLESVQEWPLVWFPILGENRVPQLEKVMALAPIPAFAEICPVVPHPSINPRRADRLLVEYREPLFDSRSTPTTNILFVHESNPFEAYRQLLGAMNRYRESMTILGGCRLIVTPLASKLITLGAGLACFEMRPSNMDANYGVAIPYAEPTRYLVKRDDLYAATPEISVLVLTGDSYHAE